MQERSINMSSSLGAISEYALSVQQMQMSLIKNAVDMQQQAIEVLLDASRTVAPSATNGINLDIEV